MRYKLIGFLVIGLIFSAAILAQEPEQGVLLTGLLSNSKDTRQEEILGEGVARALNLRLVWTYDRTGIINGTLGALATAKGIATETNGLKEGLLEEIAGYRKKVIAHSAGAITAVNLAMRGDLWGDELYLASPVLTSQNDLRQIRDLTAEGKGFKRIVLYTGDDMVPNFKELKIDFSNYTIEGKITENVEITVNLGVDVLKNYAEEAKAQFGQAPSSITIYGEVEGNQFEIVWEDGSIENFNLQKDTITGEDFQNENGIEVIPLYEGFPHGPAQLWFLAGFDKSQARLPEKEDVGLFKELIETYRNEAVQSINTAHDPNEKFVSPEGDIIPGDTLNYTITYENEGEGRAYGVYITDTLDADLDDTTLIINDETGIYDPETRTLTWLVGKVEPGGEGSFTFSIDVREDAPNNTDVLNYATVYFPSVPEETRTNAVLNTVKITTDAITSPTTQINISPAANQNGWHNSNISITLTAQDNQDGSGVKEIRYTLTGAVNQQQTISGDTANIAISSEGITTLTYYAVDNAENTEQENSTQLKLDKVPPQTIPSIVPAPNEHNWHNSLPVNVTFDAQDDLSGVSYTTEPVFLTEEGIDNIDYYSADYADNTEDTRTITVNIDTTSPELSIDLALVRGNFYRLSYSAEDTLSGVKDITAGLLTPDITNYKTRLRKSRRLRITINERNKRLTIKASDPEAVLNRLKEGLLLIKNNQPLHLKARSQRSKVWRVISVGRFLLIRVPSIGFKAEAADYAGNTSEKQTEYKKRAPLRSKRGMLK